VGLNRELARQGVKKWQGRQVRAQKPKHAEGPEETILGASVRWRSTCKPVAQLPEKVQREHHFQPVLAGVGGMAPGLPQPCEGPSFVIVSLLRRSVVRKVESRATPSGPSMFLLIPLARNLPSALPQSNFPKSEYCRFPSSCCNACSIGAFQKSVFGRASDSCSSYSSRQNTFRSNFCLTSAEEDIVVIEMGANLRNAVKRKEHKERSQP
jgi:hypothetical protein